MSVEGVKMHKCAVTFVLRFGSMRLITDQSVNLKCGKKNVGTFEWAAKSGVYTGVDAESFISMPIGGWNLHGTRNVSFT